MTLIIGTCGRARHGKSMTCQAIESFVNRTDRVPRLPARLYSFGDMVRLYCIERGSLPRVAREDMTREQLEITIRVGREQRTRNANFWVERLMQEIRIDGCEVALISNLRYLNEAEAVRSNGGYVVRCIRLNKNGSTFISEDRPPNDPTETELEFWPADFYLILKDGHAGFIAAQAVTLYEYIRELHAARPSDV